MKNTFENWLIEKCAFILWAHSSLRIRPLLQRIYWSKPDNFVSCLLAEIRHSWVYAYMHIQYIYTVHGSYTETYIPIRPDPTERLPEEENHTEPEGWKHFFFSRKGPQQTPKPTLLLLDMKYRTKMNYTQHLLIWHAKYTRLMQQYRSFCGGAPVPQCDKPVTPHLCAPTESFWLNVLLIHLIFHVTQCLTSHCRLRS